MPRSSRLPWTHPMRVTLMQRRLKRPRPKLRTHVRRPASSPRASGPCSSGCCACSSRWASQLLAKSRSAHRGQWRRSLAWCVTPCGKRTATPAFARQQCGFSPASPSPHRAASSCAAGVCFASCLLPWHRSAIPWGARRAYSSRPSPATMRPRALTSFAAAYAPCSWTRSKTTPSRALERLRSAPVPRSPQTAQTWTARRRRRRRWRRRLIGPCSASRPLRTRV
mmetsp:Transcript_3522/g.10113  ORF Transcript_3522/g.10113 Transcript_3522/m.10113 type:complete len:224 (+) Transcript_3522:580-1251(+)